MWLSSQVGAEPEFRAYHLLSLMSQHGKFKGDQQVYLGTIKVGNLFVRAVMHRCEAWASWGVSECRVITYGSAGGGKVRLLGGACLFVSPACTLSARFKTHLLPCLPK